MLASGVHAAAPASAVAPAGHARHAVPAALKVSIAHAAHAPPATAAWPAAHVRVAVHARPSDENGDDAPHGAHDVAPSSGATAFAAQERHDSAAVASGWCVPGEQRKQPAPAAYEPAAHVAAHAAAPALEYVSAAQLVQAVTRPPALYVPAAQATHELPAWRKPGSQLTLLATHEPIELQSEQSLQSLVPSCQQPEPWSQQHG